jgi:hypothetical protein
MLYKPRTESIDLLILETLATRMCLSHKDEQLYFAKKKALKENYCLIHGQQCFNVNA